MVTTNASAGQITTIERHILDRQRAHPQATGELTGLLYDIALAGKLIASHTSQAGLAEVLGATGTTNPHGEEVQRLDVMANQILYRLNDHTGRLAVMMSEESPDIIPIPDKYPTGKYVLSFDPLDGSSNIDYNVGIGTIFAIHHRISKRDRGTVEDCLQKGRDIVAAGYILYGPSTMLVYSAGHQVNGFTLDPAIGEFLLSHPNIRVPDEPQYFSANLGHAKTWSKGVQRYTGWLQGDEADSPNLSLRYIGSMVADFHRTLLSGGVFYYPVDTQDAKRPQGKLRLLYEVNPLAFLMEVAGGYTSDGRQPVLDIQPTDLHQRTPVFTGNKALVKKVEESIQKYDRQ